MVLFKQCRQTGKLSFDLGEWNHSMRALYKASSENTVKKTCIHNAMIYNQLVCIVKTNQFGALSEQTQIYHVPW